MIMTAVSSLVARLPFTPGEVVRLWPVIRTSKKYAGILRNCAAFDFTGKVAILTGATKDCGVRDVLGIGRGFSGRSGG